MARVLHPYKFRAFRTLSFLLYLDSPAYMTRGPGGLLTVEDLSQFCLRIHVQRNHYVREDLQSLARLGLIQDLELGINRATMRLVAPKGAQYV